MKNSSSKVKETERKTASFIVALVVCCILMSSGCTYSGAIRTDIAPTAIVGKKSPARVGVYFEPRLEQYVERTTPSTVYGSAYTYLFEMGPALKEALTRGVRVAYSDVSVLTTRPQPGKFDRVICFDLQSSNVRIEFVPGFWTETAKADAILHIVMEAKDGLSLSDIQRLTVSGNGFSTKPSYVGAEAHKHFSIAIEDAIRQVTENTANLLISGVAEPR